MSNIAFYAPLKPPDHPIPSGDRQMAIMLMSALSRTGHNVELASRYISYSKRHASEYMAERKEGAEKEAETLLRRWGERGYKPDLWFCYHPYDKSPDWLGMEICKALAIPMVTAEPCKTGQGPDGEWLPWRAEAQKSIQMAAMNIVMTDSDFDYVSDFIPKERIFRMPPFIDNDMLIGDPEFDTNTIWRAQGTRLAAVGMTRPGAKYESYRVLADALGRVKSTDWQLAIAGGGPKLNDVMAMFAFAGDKVTVLGELSASQSISLIQSADILTWPGCREAYGMVYLEAASFGVPSVALNNMGVPLVVEHNRTGLLATPADIETYALSLDKAISDEVLRKKMGDGARAFVAQERSVEMAAERLKMIIDNVFESKNG